MKSRCKIASNYKYSNRCTQNSLNSSEASLFESQIQIEMKRHKITSIIKIEIKIFREGKSQTQSKLKSFLKTQLKYSRN